MSREQLEVNLADAEQTLDSLLSQSDFKELELSQINMQIEAVMREIVEIQEELRKYTQELQLAENPEE